MTNLTDEISIDREHVLPVGSQAARDAIERVKQQIRPKKRRKAQGITLVDTTRPPKKEATT